MDKQTQYALKKLVTIESYDDGDLYLVDGEIILGSDECKQLFMPVGDLTGQIEEARKVLVDEIVEYASDFRANGQDYEESPNLIGVDGLEASDRKVAEYIVDRELIERVVLLLGEQKADEQ